MTKDEMLWGNIRFLLLLIFSVAAIYIILCRYILNVPTEDSSELINEINHSERILKSSIHICSKRRTSGMRLTLWTSTFIKYKDGRGEGWDLPIAAYIQGNNMNTKFLFGVLSSRMLKCQFDIKRN